MKLRKCLVMMGIVSVMGLFSACDVLEDAYDDPSVEKKEGQYYVDATDYAQWVYINLHTPTPTITTSTISLDDMSETGAPSEWDIAHHRYDVKTNGAAVVMTPYHTIEDLEMAGMPQECQWVADENSDECVTVDMSHMMEGYLVYTPGYKNTELGKWVNVDTSNMPPNYAMYDNVMLIRFADSTYAAIQLVNFMSTDRYQIKGWMTVNYQYPVF